MKKRILVLLLLVGIVGTSYSQTDDCYADAVPIIKNYYERGEVAKARKYVIELGELCKGEGAPTKAFLELKKLVFENPVKTITGVVSDKEGPIPGVTVTIRGTQKATETDFEGKYSIQVKKGAVLIFEHPNFHKKLYSINNTQKLDVTLKILKKRNTFKKNDVDGDGVEDKDDECPEVAGLRELKGCSDTDGDGIEDRYDACPEVPAFIAFKERCQFFTEWVNGVSFKMVAVKGGSFNMGSNDGEADEKPLHKVRLSNYYMGETEVTQALWEAVMGSNPSYFKKGRLLRKGNWFKSDVILKKETTNFPVEKVSWDDAQKFIKKLNSLTGKEYRLPTEAEWEFAARGGVKSKGYQYSGSNNIDEVAWYGYAKSGKKTHAVKQKKANELGLYDMSGNVWEWCADWYANDYYQVSPTDNPQGPSSGTYRLLRGGGWYLGAEYCRSANRRYNSPFKSFNTHGFRLTLSTVQ